MSKIVEGELQAGKAKFAIIVARFNAIVTERLLEGALEALQANGVTDDQIDIIKVPGAYEIPLVAQTLAQQKTVDAIITLGAVIRGETAHFDYVCSACSDGVSRIMLDTGVPIGFGVLTTDTLEQALVRAGGKGDNKGAEVALVTIEMLNLIRKIHA